eukprot:m.308187 g.308187  ORF g.308187 m.308187 type:complete len:182 (-) comp16472_c0_seq26:292-837(-)
MAECDLHILSCCVGNIGLDVGTGVTELGEKYTFEGEVVNSKAHGLGVETWEDGYSFYGYFFRGAIIGSFIMKAPDGRAWKCTEHTRLPYDKTDTHLAKLMELALKRRVAAQALASKPWTRTTNHFIKYKPKQDMIRTVLLVGERLHRRIEHTDTRQSPSTLSLCALPVEIWEMILQIVLQD